MSNKYLRIKALAKIPELSHYEKVWDLCCDHGLIGLEIHSLNPKLEVVFVDRVKLIIQKLRLKVSDIPTPGNFKIIQKDILDLQISNDKKNLLILSGIGSHLIVEFLKKHQEDQHDYLICAHQNILELRRYLRDNDYTLISEELIFENSKAYEIIYVTNANPEHNVQKVSLTGRNIWEPFTAQKANYLATQISYLQTVLSHQSSPELSFHLDEYKKIEALVTSMT